jgi:TolA-binding protein
MSEKHKLSASDWIRIGQELYQNDSKFAEQAELDGLTKEAGLWSWMKGKGWNPNKVDFQNMQYNLKNQNDLIKLHTFIQQNPGITEMVPRLQEVQGDIQKAVQQAQNQQAYMKSMLQQQKAQQDQQAKEQTSTQDQAALREQMNRLTGTGKEQAAPAAAPAPAAPAAPAQNLYAKNV